MSPNGADVEVLPDGLRELENSRDGHSTRCASESTEIKQDVTSSKGHGGRAAGINRKCRNRITARLEDDRHRVSDSVREGNSPAIAKGSDGKKGRVLKLGFVR